MSSDWKDIENQMKNDWCSKGLVVVRTRREQRKTGLVLLSYYLLLKPPPRETSSMKNIVKKMRVKREISLIFDNIFRSPFSPAEVESFFVLFRKWNLSGRDSIFLFLRESKKHITSRIFCQCSLKRE